MPKTTRSGKAKKSELPNTLQRSPAKQELYEQAKKLGVEGRSQMSKPELAEAIAKGG